MLCILVCAMRNWCMSSVLGINSLFELGFGIWFSNAESVKLIEFS